MSSTYISADLRRHAKQQANNACEYCLIHEDDTFFGCHIDHVISEKHGGKTEASNLAVACTFCNLHKGSDIASLSSEGELTRFFNPRTDQWTDHFGLKGALVYGLTPIGEVTVRILKINHSDRILEREALIAVGRYPPATDAQGYANQ